MRDDFLTRDWAEHRDAYTTGIFDALRHVWRTVKVSLDRVHAYEFDAPWRRQPVRTGRRR